MTVNKMNTSNADQQYLEQQLNKLCCPISGEALIKNDDALITWDGKYSYRISSKGIPLFAESFLTDDVERQKNHYNKVADKYIENLSYPHTIEYLSYLDEAFLRQVKISDLSNVAEICCGQGELLPLFGSQDVKGVGVDISINMLEYGYEKHKLNKNFIFVQGNAISLPLKSNLFDSVFMFGGIHHVPDRSALFAEVFRILKPGGKFYFREPVSDFILWRVLRSVVYKISPALDDKTERPLLWKETVPLLNSAGFDVECWKTYGFLGFCIFMNSDVLIFNRLFRFIPGIRFITKIFTYFDDLILKIPGFGKLGLQVVGVAVKPFKAKI